MLARRASGHWPKIVACGVAITALGTTTLPKVGMASEGPKSAVEQMNSSPPNNAAYDWAELHQDSLLTGAATNSTISTSNAGQLGVRWASNTYGAALGSPIVTTSSAGMLAIVATSNDYVMAMAASSGSIVWARTLASPVLSTPVVSNGALWVDTTDPATLYKLNPVTGATECSLVLAGPGESSLTAATPPGGKPSIFIGELDTNVSGPVMAVAASTCQTEWSFSSYSTQTGPWAPIAYGIDATGEPLVLVGTADPDQTEYAIDAVTGKLVWSFQTAGIGDYDIAAGATISPPGTNGFADGVAYVISKYGIIYALDLTTGAELWSYSFESYGQSGGRSTAALDGTDLVFGDASGVVDLNAVTGALQWSYTDPTKSEVLSSVAIAGLGDSAVVLCADVTGAFHALSLASGADLYNYETNGVITASPAVSDGDVLIASTDGFLYDFAADGGNDTTLPTVKTTSPGPDATVANPPNGIVKISGTAADQTSVAAVDVAIEAGASPNLWWDVTTNSWSPGPFDNSASLATHDQATTSWSFTFKVPSDGGSYRAFVTAHSGSGQAGAATSAQSFFVRPSATGPRMTATPFFVAPGEPVSVQGAGFRAGKRTSVTLGGTSLASVVIGPRGTFRATVKIPATAHFGASDLQATYHVGTKSVMATVPIYISNSWAEPGGDEGDTGFTPNDPSWEYYNYPFIGAASMRPAWILTSASAFDTGVAIAGGVAYVGDAAGQLLALDTHTGGVLWTWQDPSGAAIDGQPTVDVVNSRVMVGTANGHVDAISLSGHLLWSRLIGQLADAPIFSSGEVYVASASGATGELTALSERTGVITWTHALTSPAASAVSLDTNAGVVVVDEVRGTVVALTLKGAVLWSHSTPGPIAASAAIAGNVVYVGSGDTLYALSRTNGGKRWTYVAPGTIRVTPVVYESWILVASQNGSVNFLDSRTGTLNAAFAGSSAPVGVAAIPDCAFVTYSNGDVVAVRPSYSPEWGYDEYKSDAPITTPPAIVDGAVYVGNSGGDLLVFTPFGSAPD